MRIIAGSARGKRLKTLPGDDTRPTMERVKEGMFSSVQNWLPGAQVLDLFAGSGQLGLEALSRGAARCIFVENQRDAFQVAQENLTSSGLAGGTVVQSDALAFVTRCRDKFDLVLLDPPYAGGKYSALLEKVAGICLPQAVVLCETGRQEEMPQEAGGLHLVKQYRYGTVVVSRYRMEEEVAGV